MGKVCEKHPELHGQRDAYRHCVLCTKERGAAWQKLNREHVAAKTKNGETQAKKIGSKQSLQRGLGIKQTRITTKSSCMRGGRVW
jgi:hypothetical protein